jgi:dihydroorotase-like cyclic amidohydrolase
MARYDTAIVNGTVVMPSIGAMRADVGVREGRIAALADAIAPGDADQIIDARGRLVLPGAVDSHFHIGIYRDLARDAESETRSALAGGVTTVVSYFRTGSHYPEQDRLLRHDLPRGRGGHGGPRVHRFRLPPRDHDDRPARRGRLAR